MKDLFDFMNDTQMHIKQEKTYNDTKITQHPRQGTRADNPLTSTGGACLQSDRSEENLLTDSRLQPIEKQSNMIEDKLHSYNQRFPNKCPCTHTGGMFFKYNESTRENNCIYTNINDNEVIETFNETNYSVLLTLDIILLLIFIVVQFIIIGILILRSSTL